MGYATQRLRDKAQINREAKTGRHPDDKRGETWAQREQDRGQRKTETYQRGEGGQDDRGRETETQSHGVSLVFEPEFASNFTAAWQE